MSQFLLLLASLLWIQFTLAEGPRVIELNVSWIKAAPDGVERDVITFNGVWPPETIRVSKDESYILKVYNGLNDSECITMHSHGIDQFGSNPYDGVDQVTQCGIPPGETFNYQPNLGGQVGTYWIHTHIKGQYPEGLRAPFIVDDPDVPFEYDDSIVLSVSDWYDRTMKSLIPHFDTKLWIDLTAETPNAALIRDVEDTGLPVKPGKTYRLHLVNVGASALFHFWIEGHNLTIIEVDGVYVQPFATQGLDIHVGQRYSVLVTLDANPNFNYPMVAAMDNLIGLGTPRKPNATSWLVYNPAAPLPEPQKLRNWYPFDDFLSLHPLVFKGVEVPDCNITLAVTFQLAPLLSPLFTVAAINTVSYLPPVTPTILTVMDAIDPCDPSIYGATTNSHVLKYLDMVYVIIENGDNGGAHPFHLHGHTFQVLYRSPAKTKYSKDAAYPVPKNPVQRDVLVVNPGGFAIIAFKADNPGVWFFHCHIDWHVLMGMIAQFVEAPDMMQRTLRIPEEIRQQCDSTQCQTPHWWSKVGNESVPAHEENTEKEKEKGSGKELDVEDEMSFMFQSDKIETWWDKVINFFTHLWMF